MWTQSTVGDQTQNSTFDSDTNRAPRYRCNSCDGSETRLFISDTLRVMGSIDCGVVQLSTVSRIQAIPYEFASSMNFRLTRFQVITAILLISGCSTLLHQDLLHQELFAQNRTLVQDERRTRKVRGGGRTMEGFEETWTETLERDTLEVEQRI